MKSIHEFLSDFQRLDVRLWLDEGQLRYSAPEGTLTPILKSQLRERKSEIIEFLKTTEIASSDRVRTIQPVPRDRNFPLSFAQSRMWFFEQLGVNGIASHVAISLKIKGILQVSALKKSVMAIVERHEILRTTLNSINGKTVQVISPNVTLSLPFTDLRSLGESQQKAEVERLEIEHSCQPFDFERSLLPRVALLQLSDTEHIFLFTVHHVATDGWSVGIFFQELFAFYQAFTSGNSVSLPVLPIQYADYTIWQKQFLQGDVLTRELSYWQQQLQGAQTLLTLPTDRPRLPVQTFAGKIQSFALSKTLTDSLKTLSRQTGVTLFMLLLAAFGTLLYRYSGQEDILIGSPTANRTKVELEGLMGCFINPLALRIDLSGNPSFRDLLKRVRKMTLGAFSHQNLPFEQLVEKIQPVRDLSYSPLFQVMFVLQHTSFLEEIESPDLTLEFLPIDMQVTQFDLSLDMVVEKGSTLTGKLEYSTDLFDDATIARTIGHFQTLLEGISANPDLCVSELPLLTLAERHQLLAWNQTQASYPTRQCIHHLVEAQVDRNSDAVAVVFEHQQLTYRQLNQRANQLAHHLRSLGVRSEKLVGICMERSVEMVVGLLAILKAGGAYVPLDPKHPPERLSYMLADSGVEVLLTQQPLLSSLPSHTARVVCLDADWEENKQYSQENLDLEVSSDNLAYVIYTSGSTGQPKGVLVAHRNLVNAYFAWEEAYQLKTAVKNHLQMASFSFDVFSGDLVRALGSGGKLVLCPYESLLSAEKLYRLMQNEEIDCAEFVPAVMRNLIEYLQKTDRDLSFMKIAIVGSDSWYVEEHEKLRQLCHPTTRLINSYGVTESTVDSCYFDGFCDRESYEKLVPIGHPFANTQIYILDSKQQPVPIGIAGELYIGGEGLSRGYLNRPELTREKFIPNLFSDSSSERLYRTGDLARYDCHGNIEFIGRIDYQVKVRGFRIEPGEIEALLNSHPQINQAVVLVIEDTPSNKRLVAYIVTNEQLLTTNQLREFLKQKLPEYMVPSAFVILETLPLTPNGKVDRKALPAPDRDIIREQEYLAPRTQNEKAIANIFANLLGVQKVGIHDNFFELGGNSLLMVKLHSDLSQQLNIDLSLLDLFRYPTIGSLVESLTLTKNPDSSISLTDVKTEKILAGKAQQRKRLQKMKSI